MKRIIHLVSKGYISYSVPGAGPPCVGAVVQGRITVGHFFFFFFTVFGFAFFSHFL